MRLSDSAVYSSATVEAMCSRGVLGKRRASRSTSFPIAASVSSKTMTQVCALRRTSSTRAMSELARFLHPTVPWCSPSSPKLPDCFLAVPLRMRTIMNHAGAFDFRDAGQGRCDVQHHGTLLIA
jgi:hypothetical protein